MAQAVSTDHDDQMAQVGLRRDLGLLGAVSMIVGIVIGSGIFLGVNRVAAGTGSPALIVAVWVLAGILTLLGGLCYAELGAMYPRAGGEYTFLRHGFGGAWAFMSGWTAFTINLAGSGAALAIIFAEQLDSLKPAGFERLFPGEWSVKVTAAGVIILLSLINYYGVKQGGRVQIVMTIMKSTLIVLLAATALAFTGDAASAETGFFVTTEVANTPSADGFTLAGFFGLAMVAALFAYDGWTNVVRVGGELRDPQRNIPRAMILGLVAIMALYILISFGYLNVLGYEGFAAGTNAGFDNDRTVASNAASVLFGEAGHRLITVMILVSVLGALNGITLSGPRIYFAMSRDRLFPARLGNLSRHATPHVAILAQAALSIVFLMWFDFNQLTDNVVFISFFFYGLTAVGLIHLRRTQPDAPRPFKVPLYPYVPVAYVVVAWSFVAYLLWDQVTTLSWGNINRLVGLLVVAAGVPVYLYFRRRAQADTPIA